MDEQQQNIKQALKAELLQLGFNEPSIEKVLALTENKETAVELLLSFQEDIDATNDKNSNTLQSQYQPLREDLSKITLSSGLTAEQLLGMPAIVQRGSTSNIGINIANMSYPMGEDVPEVFYKMVFLVRMDLKMGVGKIVEQTANAALGAYKSLQDSRESSEVEEILENWEDCGTRKIVLKVDSIAQLLELENQATLAKINTYLVSDAGKTEVEPGNITVCAIGPGNADTIDKITGHLKLLN